MKVIYNIDKKDLGYPNWRLSININIIGYIDVKIVNFKYGFLSGESWCEIFIHNNMIKKQNESDSSYLVSLMTKSYEQLIERYDEVVTVFYTNLFNIEKKLNKDFQQQKLAYNSNINLLNSIKSSDLFKNIYRDKKINEVLDETHLQVPSKTS